MKVNVISLEDIEFSRFRFWSNWIDIAVIYFNSQPFLVQMKVNRFNGKSFKAVCMTGFSYKQATPNDIGDLLPMQALKEGE